MTPILVFDIETVPDAAGLRKLWDLAPEVSDQAVIDLASQRRRQATGSDFLPAHVQRVIAISCAMRSDEGVRVWSLGSPDEGEREIVQRFFDGIERYTPQLVSWNGSTFDLPVLQYRAMVHKVAGCCYWDMGDNNREFKFNNYLGRYHTRHLDLMEVLAMYQPRASAGLDAMARLCGFPGKLGMDGSQVAAAVTAGNVADVRNYCECDVMNTYLVYQRFRMMRGELSAGEYAKEISIAREKVAVSQAPHWKAFHAAWVG